MKKIIALSLLFLTGVFFLSACNKIPQGQNQNRSSDFSRRMPDFGQPQRQPDVRGVVKSVTGNTVTILKVDTSARRGNDTSSQEVGANSRPAVASLGGQSGAGSRGGFGGRPPGEGSGTDRATMIANLKAMSTGEETVTIPVGIKMLKPDTSTNTNTGKRQMAEASLADIAADKTVTIWLDQASTSSKVAEFVLIN